jgi:hypothetical protein
MIKLAMAVHYLHKSNINCRRILDVNWIKFRRLDMDSMANVTEIYITDYKTVKQPYEGRYLHYDIKTRTGTARVKFRTGDYIVNMPQKNMTIMSILLKMKSRTAVSLPFWRGQGYLSS